MSIANLTRFRCGLEANLLVPPPTILKSSPSPKPDPDSPAFCSSSDPSDDDSSDDDSSDDDSDVEPSRRGFRTVYKVEPVAPPQSCVGNDYGGLEILKKVLEIRRRWFGEGEIDNHQLRRFHVASVAQLHKELRWVNFYSPKEKKEGGPSFFRCVHYKGTNKTTSCGERDRSIRVQKCPVLMNYRPNPAGGITVQIRNEHTHPAWESDALSPPRALKEHAAHLLTAGNMTPCKAEATLLARGEAPSKRSFMEKIGGMFISTRLMRRIRNKLLPPKIDVRKTTDRTTPAKTEFQEAVDELRKSSADWRSEPVHVPHKEKKGNTITQCPALVFASHEGIQALKAFGQIAVMDSTHKTNRHKWPLFTILVRDHVGSWIPCAFFISQYQNATVIEACLRVIISWCDYQWPLRYMLTDDDAAEQLAVKNAFGVFHDQQPVVISLLCQKHSLETLKKKLLPHSTEAFGHMCAALFGRRTRGGCEESIRLAMAACKTREAQRYLERNWLLHTESWAHWFRDAEPLLCQVATTNVVESWYVLFLCVSAAVRVLINNRHARLKTCEDHVKNLMSRDFKFLGTLWLIMMCGRDYFRNAMQADRKNRNYTTALSFTFRGFGFEALPMLLQLKMLKQYRDAQIMWITGQPVDPCAKIPVTATSHLTRGLIIEPPYGTVPVDAPLEVETVDPFTDPAVNQYWYASLEADRQVNAPVPQLDRMPQCSCRWFKAWQLPCQHIFLHHCWYESLEPVHFEQLVTLWRGRDFRVYTQIRRPYRNNDPGMDLAIPRDVILEINQIADELRRVVYAVRERVEENHGRQEDLLARLDAFRALARNNMLPWIRGLDLDAFGQRDRGGNAAGRVA